MESLSVNQLETLQGGATPRDWTSPTQPQPFPNTPQRPMFYCVQLDPFKLIPLTGIGMGTIITAGIKGGGLLDKCDGGIVTTK